MIKYGVLHHSQNSIIHTKQMKGCFLLKIHEKTNLNYQGTYEKHFLDFCFDNNINVEKGPKIKYFFNDNEHYYFSDFYLKKFNLIVEVKSSYTYKLYLEKNIKKEKQSIDDGYNFIFLINKNYDELIFLLNKK